MRRLLATAIIVGACTGAAWTAQATTSLNPPHSSSSLITLIDQGCGPGGFRDFRGFCRLKRLPPPYHCGFRFHPTPYGCRPNY